MFSLEFEDIQRQHLSNLKIKVWRTSVSDPIIYTWEPCRHQNKCWNLLKMLTWCRKKSFINSFINCLNLVWIEHNLDLDRWRTKELSVTIFFKFVENELNLSMSNLLGLKYQWLEMFASSITFECLVTTTLVWKMHACVCVCHRAGCTPTSLMGS